jgi:hypothetical protein
MGRVREQGMLGKENDEDCQLLAYAERNSCPFKMFSQYLANDNN